MTTAFAAAAAAVDDDNDKMRLTATV